MDKLTETTRAAVMAFLRDYSLWIIILSVVLAFTIYLYLFPNAIDFFSNPAVRSEPADRPQKNAN